MDTTVAGGLGEALLEGRYRLGERIARGGMSIVYRATDLRLDRPVAVKVMDPRLAADPAFRRRFAREARAAARLDHPCVVDVHDQGSHEDGLEEPVVFLVMELVEGATLRDVLAERRALPVAEALAVFEPVLSGLAAAHQLGLVHRDVKPENVLISPTGQVKVADFGLVTAAAEAGASTAGMIMGTVAYLSPEQVTTGTADPRSDVYAAGILLYEMLTGVPPYQSETPMSVAYRHVNDTVPAPSARAPQVPAQVDELVELATRRDPAARPSDAAALGEHVRQVRAALNIPRVAVPVPPSRTIPEPQTVPVGPIPEQAPMGHGEHRPAAEPIGPRGTRIYGPASQAAPQHGSPRGGAPSTAPAGAPPAIAVHPHLQARRRSRKVFLGWMAGLVILALLVALTAWWLGGRMTSMPSLVGLEQVAAQEKLTEAGLDSKVTQAPHDDMPAGKVIDSQPRGPAELASGTEVLLTVSSGRPKVPAISAGTSRAEAERLVRDAVLNPKTDSARDEFSATAASGTLVRTAPAAGTELKLNAAVILVLSKGPPPQEVDLPLVIGQKVKDAQTELEGLGFTVRTEAALPFGTRNRQVVNQSPGPGKVKPGSTVVLQTI